MIEEFGESADYDKFNLFYVEAIMSDTAFPRLSQIKPIFEKITFYEFISLMQQVFDSSDYELTQQFFYFLILFRDMEHLQRYINSADFGIEMLEKLIIFTYGYCTVHDHSTERIIDEILYFLSNDRLLELAEKSEYIYNDKLLLFFILSKFDIDMLNRYFSKIKNIPDFINYFLRLPEDVLRSIISRNYHLFQYIMLMMAESDSEHAVSEEFYERYRADIEQFSRLNDIIREYRTMGSFDHEKELPFNRRDMSRISFLVNMIKELPDSERAVEYFDGEHVFLDEMEKKIVLAVVNDPLLRDTFNHYDSMFDVD